MAMDTLAIQALLGQTAAYCIFQVACPDFGNEKCSIVYIEHTQPLHFRPTHIAIKYRCGFGSMGLK